MHATVSIVPRDKFDFAAANAAAQADWSRIEPVAAQLLVWVQDANWPVAQVLAPALANVGAPLAPYVRRVLTGEDETWKFHLVGTVVSRSAELRLAVRPELERLASLSTPSELTEEVAAVAREALEQS